MNFLINNILKKKKFSRNYIELFWEKKKKNVLFELILILIKIFFFFF
jgi:hypothetical protein